MTITVRPARADDAAGIATVHIRAWQSAYDRAFPKTFLDRLDLDAWTARRQRSIEHRTPDAHLFVALVDGLIVGFADVAADRAEADNPSAGEILAIYVDPAHWSTGAGFALMSTCVTALDRDGRTDIRLWTLDDNPRARRFYERFGFTDDGARNQYTLDAGGPDETAATVVRYRLHVR